MVFYEASNLNQEAGILKPPPSSTVMAGVEGQVAHWHEASDAPIEKTTRCNIAHVNNYVVSYVSWLVNR